LIPNYRIRPKTKKHINTFKPNPFFPISYFSAKQKLLPSAREGGYIEVQNIDGRERKTPYNIFLLAKD